MAVGRKPAVKKVKFEISRSGVAGIGIVCFCIFLWMFLLGVWTGQSLLIPSGKTKAKVAQKVVLASPQNADLLHIEAVASKKLKKR